MRGGPPKRHCPPVPARAKQPRRGRRRYDVRGAAAMSTTEAKMVYIILGMILAFTAIFILITCIPGERLNWLFQGQ
jgi:hypothetical protein